MAIYDERDATRSRMDIDEIVERDSSSSFIVLIVLAIAVVLGGWYIYSISQVTPGALAGAMITQPTNVPAVQHPS